MSVSQIDVGDMGMTAVKVMEAQGKLLEEALRCVLVHVPSNEVTMDNLSGEPYALTIIARGLPMYEVTADMFGVEVTVSGGWLSWPPPEALDLGGEILNALSKRRR